MIFPNLKTESILQVNDKTRLNASASFISSDEAAVTLVEIEPHTGVGFIDVTNVDSDKWFLDWSYDVNEVKTATVRITTDGVPVTFSQDIEVLSVADDRLFSDDSDLVPYEHDILDYVPRGRSSHLDKHRAAQGDILKRLDELNITNTDGSRIVKANIAELEEVSTWSKFLTMAYVFESVSNAIDDIFAEKALKYRQMATRAESRSRLRLDLDQDGDVDTIANMTSFDMVRR